MKTYRLVVLYTDKTYEWFDFGNLHNLGLAILDLEERQESGGKTVISMQMITLADDVE